MLGTADLLTENQVAEQLANITDGLPDEWKKPGSGCV